ncbi:MAG TPA: hypothetical protein VEK57_01310 [Thermoanaerobaculia bacterium]|nr:hypothetical protein [Thermoanaerobaculia bacterium]
MTAGIKHWVGVLTLLFVFAEAQAAPRLEIVAEFEGKRQEGIQACFSPAKRYGSVLSRMVSGPEVRCVSADRILAIPRGTWHVYLVKEDGSLVSTHPFKIVLPSGSDENEEVMRLEAQLVPGARLDLARLGAAAPGRSLGVYVSDPGGLPAIVPVRRGQDSIVLPAGMHARPLELDGESVTRVGREVRPGERASAEWETSPVVVIPITTDGVSLENRPLPFLGIVSRSSGEAVRRFELSKEVNGLLFLDPAGLGPGTYDVQTEGDRWLAAGPPLRLPVEEAVAEADDVRLEPVLSALSVDWWIDPDLLAPAAGCGSAESEPVSAEVRLLVCPPGTETLDRRTEGACSVIRRARVPEAIGAVSWPRPGSGEVWAQVRVGGLSTATRPVTSRDESRATLRLAPRVFRGTVRLGSEPLNATVFCGSSAATSDALSGDFRCWLPEKPIFPMVLRVLPCDGSQEYAHVVADSEAADRIIEITLPDNALSVQVSDTRGSPLADVHVWSFLGKEEGDLGPTRDFGTTSADGLVKSSRFPPGQPFTVCAGRRGYLRECRGDLELTASESRGLKLSLAAETSRSGRIASATPIAGGDLFAVSGGQVIGRARVSEDGLFSLGAAVSKDMHFVLSSASHPLTVLDRAAAAESLVLNVPSLLESRDFRVESAEPGPVTLILNGVLIPVNVTLHHQSRFGEQYYVRPNLPLRLKRVNAFGTVVVVLGSASNVDAFHDPRLLQAMRKQVLGAEPVVRFH